MKLEITIPVLNEEETLDRQIRIVDAYLAEHFDADFQVQVLIGDNGSTDKTEAIGRALEQDLERVRYVNVCA